MQGPSSDYLKQVHYYAINAIPKCSFRLLSFQFLYAIMFDVLYIISFILYINLVSLNDHVSMAL